MPNIIYNLIVTFENIKNYILKIYFIILCLNDSIIAYGFCSKWRKMFYRKKLYFRFFLNKT